MKGSIFIFTNGEFFTQPFYLKSIKLILIQELVFYIQQILEDLY